MFFLSRKLTFFFICKKKKGISKKCCQFWKNVTNFHVLKLFFLFFCIHVHFALVITFFSLQFATEFHQAVYIFFLQNCNYAAVFCNYGILKFWLNCPVSLKLVYELKVLFGRVRWKQYFIPRICRKSQKMSQPRRKSDIIPEISQWEKCIFDNTLRNLNFAAKFAKLNFLVKKMDFRP